jgi:carboxymethylenebutenolidase
MLGKTIKIRSSEGGELDCYLAASETDGQVPAIVLASAVHGVDKLPRFNGRAAAMGFCYGGPYAILGPKRLGYAAGISCHGTQMIDYIQELAGVDEPVCIIWGDQDHRAPAEVLDAYRGLPSQMKNMEVHICPGVLHGYMMRGIPKAFHQETHDFSMTRTLAILDGLRGGGVQQSLRQAS